MILPQLEVSPEEGEMKMIFFPKKCADEHIENMEALQSFTYYFRNILTLQEVSRDLNRIR